MSPLRRSLLALLLVACAPARSAVRRPSSAPSDVQPPAPERKAEGEQHKAKPPTCAYQVRRLSAPGRGAVRPHLAAGEDAFAVAWEETSEHHAVRVQTFALDGHPLGPSIEVADVARAAAEPRLAADGDGFTIFWSAERSGGATMLAMRHVDRAGKPKSDALPVIVAPSVRALDVAPTDGGYAVAWWSAGGSVHPLFVSFVDNKGRPLGRPLSITRTPTPAPTVELAPGAALGRHAPMVVTWSETVGELAHVIVADVSRAGLDGRVDVGAGETPQLGAGVVVFERPADTSIWAAPIVGAAATERIAGGHRPAAAPRAPLATALCYLRDAELVCATLASAGGGLLVQPTRIAVPPRALSALGVATSGDRIGVAWQAQDGDDSSVSFASLTCPGVGVAPAPR
jgi:hypothetical protein